MTAAATATESVLRAEDVVISYPSARRHVPPAVAGVSISIKRGETLGVVGETGSGKTTLGKALAGFIHPTSGRVLLDSRPLVSDRSRRHDGWGMRDVQMIFQNPLAALDPRLPAWRSVAEGIRAGSREERRLRASELLQSVGIETRLHGRRPRELSGGERQRVTIARAVASTPSFLVCDEATSGLDVSVRGGILNVLRDLRDSIGLGCVFITHDISLMARFVDRVAVMYAGRVIEDGSVGTVMAAPSHPYTQDLLRSVPRLGEPEERTEIAAPTARNAASDVSIHPPAAIGCAYSNVCPLVLPVCKESEPKPRQLATAGHRSACVRADEFGDAAAPENGEADAC